MKEIRTVLVDDEQDSTELLKLYLENHCEGIQIVGVYNSSTEALKNIPKLDPDLLFLDIEMPVMNGFELLFQLDDLSFNVVFVTAYNQFAVQAFKFNALDYIVKPIHIEELIEVTEKARQKLHLVDAQIQTVAQQIKQGSITKIAISTPQGIAFIDLKDIVLLESNGNYSVLKFQDRQDVIISKTLKSIQYVFELQNFMRVHRQYMINLNMVKYYNRKDGLLTMVTGENIPVSRNLREDLIARFNIL